VEIQRDRPLHLYPGQKGPSESLGYFYKPEHWIWLSAIEENGTMVTVLPCRICIMCCILHTVWNIRIMLINMHGLDGTLSLKLGGILCGIFYTAWISILDLAIERNRLD